MNKHRSALRKILSTRNVPAIQGPGRSNPVRVCGAEEARLMAFAGNRKTYTIAQLLRGRYVLRHKGKAQRQHKLTSKGYLHVGVRNQRKRRDPTLFIAA